MRCLSFALLILLLPITAWSDGTYDATVAGRNCRDFHQQLSCEYRVGKSLHFEIAGIGDPDTAVTFYKVDWDGDYYATWGLLHGCVIVKAGAKARDPSPVNTAFVSPLNGKVYRTWQACSQRL